MKHLFGNTYPIKEQIKKAGGKWDSEKKAWLIPDSEFERIKSMIPEKETKKNDIRLIGQIWEECPICDQEPIYLSHGVCECCAISGKSRSHVSHEFFI